jgi:hypothetical protein
MADSIDSAVLVVERSNIFAPPEDRSEPAGRDAGSRHGTGVFTRPGCLPVDAGEDRSARRHHRRRSPVAAFARPGGISIRGSVCLAAVVTVVMTVLVLDELGGEPVERRERAGERHTVGIEAERVRAGATKRHRPSRPATPPIRRHDGSRRSRARERSARRSRGAAQVKACCRAEESKRRSAAGARSVRRPVLPAPRRGPATPVEPSPAPPAGPDPAAPAPVPAGTPPEFM